MTGCFAAVAAVAAALLFLKTGRFWLFGVALLVAVVASWDPYALARDGIRIARKMSRDFSLGPPRLRETETQAIGHRMVTSTLVAATLFLLAFGIVLAVK